MKFISSLATVAISIAIFAPIGASADILRHEPVSVVVAATPAPPPDTLEVPHRGYGRR